ncbi:hypothetical protein BIW11_06978 [Tropilaelaps mercedesae]|uniref:Histone deacetylase complex subunit SAP130 C-terminal domain-containing protein n=1 Tax=Tropilaelaps mercedesae TaxID=418985 RepID=A0A1V9XW14_9ACAR|nr:hypothetical protein BIW11_06978 [Tropilaelaps mercedesae]
MSSGGDSKPPDPGVGGTRVVAPLATPVDLARVVVKPALPELPSVSLAQATHTTHLTALPTARIQQTTGSVPPASLAGSVISAAPASQTASGAIFTPSSHLIVPAASKTASLRPPIRPLHPTPVVATGVQKMVTPTGVSSVGVKTAPTVVQHVSRTPVIPVQQQHQQGGAGKRPTTASPSSAASAATNASLIRSPQFSSHVPRGPATVASITAGPKTGVPTPIIRQTGAGGQNVVLAPTLPVGATRTAQGATLTATRSFAPVTMVEVAKPGVSVGVNQGAQQLHLGLQPSITIESNVARASGASHKTQTVYAPAIFQPVVSGGGGGDKISPTTAAFFKTTGPAVHQATQFTKGGTTFTPITTSQPQAVVQAAQAGVTPVVSVAGGVAGVPAGTQAVTITSKMSVSTSAAAGQQHFGKVTPQPVFVANNKAGGVSNVVITTSQRPVRNVTTTQVTTAVTNTSNLAIPMAKVYQQQPLTVSSVSAQGADLEGQPQPIGFMTAAGPRLQLPVISVGGQGVGAVQGAAPPGAVVLAGPEGRTGATAQYAMPAGAYLTYETYPAYFGGQSGTSTPVHLTTATIPGVRAVSPRAPFSAPRPLMVTVDTKVHPAPGAQPGVISVTASKASNVHPSATAAAPAPAMSVGVPPTIETSGGVTVTPVEVPAPSATPRIITSEAIIAGGSAKLTTSAEHSSKLMEKVITQSLNTPVNPSTAPLPLSLSISPVSVSALSAAAVTSVSVTTAAAVAAAAAPGGVTSAISSPSRPSILRKRPAAQPDQCPPSISNLRKDTNKDETTSAVMLPVKQESLEDNNNTSISVLQSSNSGDIQHTTIQHQQHTHLTIVGGQNGQVASPRKKPRKQLLQMAEGEPTSAASGVSITAKRKENGRGEALVEREPASSPGTGKHLPQQQRPQLFGVQVQPNWKARFNHFVHHSDVRSKDDKRPTVNELANQKCAAQRAHGWKLYHIKGQVEEVETIESDVFQRFSKILDAFENSTNHRPSDGSTTSHLSPEDEKMFNKITDLIKGNLQRSKIMQDQVGEVKKQLVKVLDHKPRVLDVIGKHVSKRPLKKREKL